ncbi:MAG: hypothetical protein QXM65_07770 [Candidatus Bathyarchaeia archaeon]
MAFGEPLMAYGIRYFLACVWCHVSFKGSFTLPSQSGGWGGASMRYGLE